MQYNKQFYKETGYKVTETVDPVYPENISNALAEGFLAIEQESPMKARRVLDKLREKFPDVPDFVDLLVIFAAINDAPAVAEEAYEMYTSKFPDYVHGKLSRLNSLIDNASWDELETLLGNFPDMHQILDLEVVPTDIFMIFHQILVSFELNRDDLEEARTYHEKMFRLAPNDHLVREVAHEILEKQLELHFRMGDDGLDYMSEFEESFPTVSYPQITKAPTFQHKVMETLYDFDYYDLPREIVDKILGLPRQSAVADLVKVLEDGMRRHEYFNQKDMLEGEAFMAHALFLLGGMQRSDQLQTVLNVLRQGEDFLHYWFMEGDVIDYFEHMIFANGQDQLDVLNAFVKEPNLCLVARDAAMSVAVQVAMHYPERRAETIDWFADVLDFFDKNSSDRSLVSPNFVRLICNNALYLRIKELLPRIKKINEHFSNENIIASWDKYLLTMDRPMEASVKTTMPADTWEYFSQAYKDRQVGGGYEAKHFFDYEWFMEKILDGMLDGDLDEDGDFFDDHDTLYEEDGFDFSDNAYSDNAYSDNAYSDDNGYEYSPSQPAPLTVVRDGPKVGRNDPCPCGSGKKYKKCCL